MPGSLPDDDSPKPGVTVPAWTRRAAHEVGAAALDRQRRLPKRIGSQLELAEALAKAGCPVTQATVSRDIRELRLEKTSDALGRPRYVVPGRGSRRDPRESLNAVLEQFGVRATAAQNIVVVQSELGSAPAIARALDRLEHPKIVGTLAGDDTCLVITAGPADAKKVAPRARVPRSARALRSLPSAAAPGTRRAARSLPCRSSARPAPRRSRPRARRERSAAC